MSEFLTKINNVIASVPEARRVELMHLIIGSMAGATPNNGVRDYIVRQAQEDALFMQTSYAPTPSVKEKPT